MNYENECKIKQELEAMSPCFPTTIPSNICAVRFHVSVHGNCVIGDVANKHFAE